MGTWDTGPFDSDHAADFASAVIGASEPSARHDLFSITFGAFMDMPDTHPDMAMMCDEYELPSIILEVVASAAYVADGATGDTRWIDSVYARGTDRVTNDLCPVVELGEINGHMVANAHAALAKALRLMRAARISGDRTEPVEQIATTLRAAMG